MATWRDFQETPDANTAAPPVGAPEGNFRGSSVNDCIRYLQAVCKNLGLTTLKIAAGEGTAFTSESVAGTMALQDADAVVITGGSISGVTVGSIPVGAIIPFSGTSPSTTLTEAAALESSGWAICDGRTVSGRTTPDLRGTFVRGWASDITPAATGGAASVTTSSGGAHDHNGSTTGALYSAIGNSFVKAVSGGTFDQHTHPIPADAGHSHTVATVPPWYAVVYLQRVA